MGNIVRESVEGIGISNLPHSLGNKALFTEIAIPEIVKIPEIKPDIEQLLSVMVDAKIVSLRLIKTPVGTSHEGQILTGKKLSIELLLKQKVKYIADEPTQSVHAAHFEHIVNSIFVIVPAKIGCKKIESILREGKLKVTPYIEDIYGEQLDKRTIFKNITLLIHVTSPCLVPARADLRLLKSVSKNHVKVDDIITYTIVVKNSGSIKATNVILKDPLNPYVHFEDNVKIDGASASGDPTTSGIPLGEISPGISKVVTFDVKVTSLPPDHCKIKNTSNVTYNYIDSDGHNQSDSSTSNTVVVKADLVKLGIVKTGTVVTSDQKITYTIVVKNEGTVTINDILFKDPLTPSVGSTASFVPNSFMINGAHADGDPTTTTTGINIGSLAIDESMTLSFEVSYTVTGTGTVANTAMTTFTYNLDSCVPPQNGSKDSDTVTLPI